MNDQQKRQLGIASDSKAPLPARLRALEALAQEPGMELVPRLLELWRRPRTAPPKPPVNWDPAGADRVLDLYLILALYKSGDASLLPEISSRVAQAKRVLQGPEDELRNAAKVIKAIGKPEVVYQLVALGVGRDPEAVANGVRVLQYLNLPSPASGGSVDSIPELKEPVNFTFHRLREEIETVAKLSKGKILISSGVHEFLTKKDFDRGEVKRENYTLASFLTQDLDQLDLTYSAGGAAVMLQTFPEAGRRWQQWWTDNTARR